ncbi:QacE family quaternary ammonium compound efflux SMR transporter [Bacillus cereus]|uniref:DMT family transporter n=1 Tax=unclassified Bacillus (in: firmicutes) TaxID=185979 RepID=UPI00047A24EF|nr:MULTISPECIES: multidrug efflux SMR transporter [unclassified Bacillus (in: firmicutes)]PFE04790.1 QacE family quaternary ammonium compound efflux SMR transporter [Bacillus sp. AFS023182]PGX96041.1 QacE family quaternary ammonium compound efflux SMR transporter [Bacillus cereus]SDZ31347.1 multidrug resistance protein EbrA [Bacillus sp. 166amftsu]
MKAFLFLAIAIVSEVFGTTMLKVSNGFTKVLPSIGVVLGFASAFFFLSKALQHIQLSTAYAIWSGVGTALTALIGVLVWKDVFTWQTAVGLVLIIGGVAVLNMSGSSAH